MKPTLRYLLPAALLLPTAGTVWSQSFFGPSSSTFISGPANSATTEFSRWDNFYSPGLNTTVTPAGDGLNLPDIAAPNGISQSSTAAGVATQGNWKVATPVAFWNSSNPTLRQTVAAGVIVTSTRNIYGLSAAPAIEVSDSTPFNLGSVNFQWATDGGLFDFSSLKLIANGVEYLPKNFITEYKPAVSDFGLSLQNRVSAQWDLSALGNITSYKIVFNAFSSNSSLTEALLNTSATYSELTPSDRTWNAASGNFSNGTNWSTGSVVPTAGNVNVTGGGKMTIDGGTREISELRLSAALPFQIDATGGGKLKLNTGITASPSAATAYQIDSAVTFGTFNVMKIGANANVTMAGVIDGNGGLYKSGTGKLSLTNNNTFDGQIVVEGGDLIMAGTNTYAGTAVVNTTVFAGNLILRGNAPMGAAGTLGNTTTDVALGSGGTLGGQDAALLIEGAFSVDRGVRLTAGGDGKILGGQNTGAGAAFTGPISLDVAAGNVSLRALNASDRVTFSGALSGGDTTLSLTKTGAGTVVLSGVNKSYDNATTVAAGTLQVATGTALNGNGAMTVSAGSRLTVNGSLNGSGALTLNGGTLAGNGTINRVFALDNGDTLSAGDNGIGTLRTGAETWASAGRLHLEISGVTNTPGVTVDSLAVTGALSLTATSGGKFVLELASLTSGGSAGALSGFSQTTNYTWTLATASGGITGFSASAFQIDTSGFANAFNGSFAVSQSGNDLLLTYAVPEPNTGWLAAMGLAAVGAWRRRRR